MDVTTLDETDFAHHCLLLESGTRDYAPDLIVSIARGGDYVASHIYSRTPHVSVRLQRPTTALKRMTGRLTGLVRLLPLETRNRLRSWEHRRLMARNVRVPDFELDSVTRQAIEGATSVLVVDDAVDTGATLAAVLRAIRAVPGTRAVHSAAIAVTAPDRAVCLPDTAVYTGRGLVRFPWSMDYNDKDYGDE